MMIMLATRLMPNVPGGTSITHSWRCVSQRTYRSEHVDGAFSEIPYRIERFRWYTSYSRNFSDKVAKCEIFLVHRYTLALFLPNHALAVALPSLV